MKKILFLLFTLLMIAGCGKDEDNTSSVVDPSDNNSMTEENIFKETGCKPKDIKSIKRMWVFVDSLKNDRYLYGSKMKNDIESFWVAKFTPQGEQVWETIKSKEESSSNAYYPNIISTGDIVFENVIREGESSIKEASPVIINSKDGSLKLIDIFEGYIYSDIYIYDNFFVCSISQPELDKNPLAKNWHVQISNNGKILSQNGEFRAPDGKTIWPTDSVYICMNSKYILKGQIYSDYPLWTYKVNLPKYITCKEELSINADEIKASYLLTTEDSKQDTITYRISNKTGKDVINVEGISIEPKEKGLMIGEEYTLTPVFTPEDASSTDVIWKSSDEKIAIIDGNGKVTAINNGECLMTVTTKDGDFKATCKIKVTSKYDVNGIYFTNSTEKIILGSSLQLKATITPITALNQNLKWYSSDKSIASIDANGIVTGNSIGTAIITAETEEGGYKSTCEVIVTDIRDFIKLNFSASITSLINGFVTGSIYSQITNHSTETIKVTNLTIIDTNSNTIVAMADQSMLGELHPNSSFNIGGTFYMVYYPMFVWEFEYKNKTYTLSHTFLQSTYSAKSTSKNIDGLIWLKK